LIVQEPLSTEATFDYNQVAPQNITLNLRARKKHSRTGAEVQYDICFAEKSPPRRVHLTGLV